MISLLRSAMTSEVLVLFNAGEAEKAQAILGLVSRDDPRMLADLKRRVDDERGVRLVQT